jgi:hypothetical protein
VDPAGPRIYEAFKRRADGQWLVRTYSPVSQGKVERTASMGPDSLLDDTTRSYYTDLGRTSDGNVVLGLLQGVGDVAAAASG